MFGDAGRLLPEARYVVGRKTWCDAMTGVTTCWHRTKSKTTVKIVEHERTGDGGYCVAITW